MADTKDRTVEQMATACARYRGRGFAEYEDRGIAEAVLPIAVKAVTDRVRGGLPDAAFQGLVTTDDLLALLDQIDAELGGE